LDLFVLIVLSQGKLVLFDLSLGKVEGLALVQVESNVLQGPERAM